MEQSTKDDYCSKDRTRAMKIPGFILRLCGHPFLATLFLWGLGFLVLSFGIYFLQRFMGVLPSQEEWFRQGAYGPNHGPWHAQPESFLVLWPHLLLIPLTLISSVVLSIWKRRFWLLVHGVGISIALVLMICLQWEYLLWVID